MELLKRYSNEFFELMIFNEKKFSFDDVYSLIVKLDSEFFPPLSSRTDLKKYAKKLIKEAVLVFVVNREEKDIAGMAAYYCTPSLFDYAELSFLGVLDEYKKRGIATKLTKYMIKDCKLKGAKGIKTKTWDSNKLALDLYLKNGFKIINKKEDNYFKRKSVIIRLDFDQDSILKKYE